MSVQAILTDVEVIVGMNKIDGLYNTIRHGNRSLEYRGTCRILTTGSQNSQEA